MTDRTSQKRSRKQTIPISSYSGHKRRKILLRTIFYDIQGSKAFYYSAIVLILFGIINGIIYLCMSMDNISSGTMDLYINQINQAVPSPYVSLFALLCYSYGYFSKSSFVRAGEKNKALGAESLHGNNMIYDTLSIMPIKVTDVYKMQAPLWIMILLITLFNLLPYNMICIYMGDEYPVKNLLGCYNAIEMFFPLLIIFDYFGKLIFHKYNWIETISKNIMLVVGIIEVFMGSFLILLTPAALFINQHIAFGFFTGKIALTISLILILCEILIYYLFVVKNKHGITAWE